MVAVIPVAHVILHHGAQQRADLLRDDLTADGRLRLADHVAGFIGDGIHHVGRHQIAPVDYGRHGGCHLQRRDRHVLAEGGGVQVGLDVLHVLRVVVDHPAGLVGQVNAGGLVEPERLKIIVAHPGAHLLGGLHKVDVAAVVQRASHVQLAVGHAVGAAVGVLILGALVDHIAAGCTVIHLIGGDQAGIQRRGRRDQLEHRTGIVQLGDVFVFPLGLPQHALQDGVFVIVNEAVHQIFLGLGLAKPVFQRGGGSGVQQAVFQNVA